MTNLQMGSTFIPLLSVLSLNFKSALNKIFYLSGQLPTLAVCIGSNTNTYAYSFNKLINMPNNH